MASPAVSARCTTPGRDRPQPGGGTGNRPGPLLREAEVDGRRLWTSLGVEARVGRPLFFANA